MKALIISSLLFFSLRAMSADQVGEDKKGDCLAGNQSGRSAKEVVASTNGTPATPDKKAVEK